MTIKKLKTVKAAPQPSAASAAQPAEGEVADLPADASTTTAAPKAGATIADRFKLDVPDPKVKAAATGSKKSAQFALTAALAAIAAAGILAFVLYKHWEFFVNA